MQPHDPPEGTPPRLIENVGGVRSRIAAAAARAGRDPDSVRLVAITKIVPAEIVDFLPAVGIADAGESRIQEASAKLSEIRAELTWHLVGHLQRNKVRAALSLFSLIHSVDSERLLDALARHAGEAGRRVPVLLQVNVSREGQKFGFEVEDVRAALAHAARNDDVEVTGLMGMAPWVSDPEEARPAFRALREIRDDANHGSWYREPLAELSMGMTNDFEIAVEEGATMVRVGTALFRGVTVPRESDAGKPGVGNSGVGGSG
jgi:pyridoxal phosphate enzyme (YggS family)